ncbi:MAG: glucose 1-dehydrogenase [Bacillota bacterium]
MDPSPFGAGAPAGEGLAGKVAVVTGGGQGIGRAVALRFAAEGMAVVIAEIDPEAGAEAEALIRSRGGRCLFIPCDVSDSASVRAMVDRAVAEFGAIHVLVNNAGIAWAQGDPLDDEAEERWARVIGTNLTGAFLCARHVAPHMRAAGGGAIINIASTRALMSEPGWEAYDAAKAGLLGLTRSLAVTLGPLGIRVNAISPGWIEVSAWKKSSLAREPELRPEDHAQHPVGRVGWPEDIAEACLFLADPRRSGFITGQNLVVDGGMTVKMIYVD